MPRRKPKAPEPIANVNPDLKSLLTPLDILTTDPRNTRKHNDPGIAAIAMSLDRFGQQKPVVARKDGSVVAGNGTIQAARKLGWTHVAAVRFTNDEITSKAYAIADNRTAELSEWDVDELQRTLKEIEDSNIDPIVTGWSPEELDALVTGEEFMLPDLRDQGDDQSDMKKQKNTDSQAQAILIGSPDVIQNIAFKKALHDLAVAHKLSYRFRV